MSTKRLRTVLREIRPTERLPKTVPPFKIWAKDTAERYTDKSPAAVEKIIRRAWPRMKRKWYWFTEARRAGGPVKWTGRYLDTGAREELARLVGSKTYGEHDAIAHGPKGSRRWWKKLPLKTREKLVALGQKILTAEARTTSGRAPPLRKALAVYYGAESAAKKKHGITAERTGVIAGLSLDGMPLRSIAGYRKKRPARRLSSTPAAIAARKKRTAEKSKRVQRNKQRRAAAWNKRYKTTRFKP